VRDGHGPGTVRDHLLKVEGAGNDFLLGTGGWADRLTRDPGLVARLCRRHRGVGADGALAVVAAGEREVRLHYRNADGSEAAFCANGTRCAARAAVELLGMPPRPTILTAWAPIPAVVEGEAVTLELPPPGGAPRPVELEAGGRTWAGWLLEVGVPHLVLPVQDLGRIDLATAGPALRGHPDLGAGGANVNLVEPAGPGLLAIRSFERGVEAETLSCGSGVVAAALCWLADGHRKRLAFATRSGDELVVEVPGDPVTGPARLTGPARFVAEIRPLEER